MQNKKKYRQVFIIKQMITIDKHNHLLLKFNKKILLIYNDVRKFGFIKIFKTNKIFLSLTFKKT